MLYTKTLISKDRCCVYSSYNTRRRLLCTTRKRCASAGSNDVTGDARYTEHVWARVGCGYTALLINITVMEHCLQAVMCKSNSYWYKVLIDTNFCVTFSFALIQGILALLASIYHVTILTCIIDSYVSLLFEILHQQVVLMIGD